MGRRLGQPASCGHERAIQPLYRAEHRAPDRTERRLAQSLYALAALVCLLSTEASVIALAVVQLYYIVSPRLPRIQRERA
jgi:hypothetical protein